MKIRALNSKNRLITLQLIGWGVILGTTLLWSVGSNSEVLDRYALAFFVINIIMLLLIYGFNYLIFIPRYLFNDHKRLFTLSNILLISVLVSTSYCIVESGVLNSLRPADAPLRHKGGFMYLFRDVINYVLMIGMVTALRLSERLQRSEEALREAESARVKAELDNLRSQINPHFLLNTLNNIYVLTAIDADKAQKTIKELSDLLRYILYDNLNDKVSLKREMEFLKTYIELMSIRLPRKVNLTTEFEILPDSMTDIAPLIFISLIENAFKHSVSASGEGFITIHFSEDRASGDVTLRIKNSNNAKLDSDKSGHGIGLEQVRRRLELLYADNYEWVVESSEDVYSSLLTLKNCR